MTSRVPFEARRGLERTGRALAEDNARWLEQRDGASDEAIAAGARALVRSRSPGAHAPRSWSWVRWMAGGAAAALIVFVLWSAPWATAPTAALIARVGTTEIAQGERVAAEDAATELSFSDGSSMTVLPGASARLLSLQAEDLRIALDEGSLDVRIVHHSGRTWWVQAGAFSIEVVGTAFEVSYAPSDATLGIALREGKIRVSGPCSDPEELIVAPIEVTLGCPKDDGASADADAAASAVAAEGAEPPAPHKDDAEPRGGDAMEYLAALEAGDYKRAFTLAKETGLERAVGSASPSQLLDLAVGARLAGDGEAARGLYTAVRERHPGTDAAANAAFHLGRTAFDDAGDWAGAEAWFTAYWSERPGGALAGEALGRAMECAMRLQAEDRASHYAETYLERFPNGPLAGRAQELVSASP